MDEIKDSLYSLQELEASSVAMHLQEGEEEEEEEEKDHDRVAGHREPTSDGFVLPLFHRGSCSICTVGKLALLTPSIFDRRRSRKEACIRHASGVVGLHSWSSGCRS